MEGGERKTVPADPLWIGKRKKPKYNRNSKVNEIDNPENSKVGRGRNDRSMEKAIHSKRPGPIQVFVIRTPT